MKRITLFFAAFFLFNTGFTQVTPGGVSTNLSLWLKANVGALNGAASAIDGQSVNTWQDQTTVRTNDATSATLAPPTFRDNVNDYINFNPVVDFDGVNDGLDFGNDYIFSSGVGSQDGVTYFAVVEPDIPPVVKPFQYIFDFGGFNNSGYGFRYSNNDFGMYTPLLAGGIQSGTISHNKETAPRLVRFTVDFKVDQTIHLDGNDTAALTNTFVNVPTLSALDNPQITQGVAHAGLSGPVTIGQQSKSGVINNNNGRRLDGSIAEVIGYTADLDDSAGGNIAKIESYLAVKYGITLDNSGGGASGDYTSSNGTTTWDASDSSVYHHDVIGIGRDDNAGLLQKQSHQLNDSTRIYLSILNNSNVGNAGAFSGDDQFVLMGHNNKPMQSLGSTEYPSGQLIYSRIEREWKITNTAFSDTFSLDITLDTIAYPIADMRMLIDTDGDFTNATMHNPTISLFGTTVTISGLSNTEIPLNSTRYVTLVYTTGYKPDPKPVSVEELDSDLIKIYPNPTTDQITITGSQSELEEIRIYNASGQDVTGLTKRLSENDSSVVIDLSRLSSGVYQIQTKNSVKTVGKQ